MSPYRGLCGWCVALFKCIPVIVISAIVGWSYYAYVVQLCIKTVWVDSEVAMVILLILYHIFITFFVVSLTAYQDIPADLNFPNCPISDVLLAHCLDQAWGHP